MKINIIIEGKQSDLSPMHRDRLRRALGVIDNIGFDINLSFTEKEDDTDMVDYFPGDKYPHVGYYIKMVKTDNQRLDKPQ